MRQLNTRHSTSTLRSGLMAEHNHPGRTATTCCGADALLARHHCATQAPVPPRPCPPRTTFPRSPRLSRGAPARDRRRGRFRRSDLARAGAEPEHNVYQKLKRDLATASRRDAGAFIRRSAARSTRRSRGSPGHQDRPHQIGAGLDRGTCAPNQEPARRRLEAKAAMREPAPRPRRLPLPQKEARCSPRASSRRRSRGAGTAPGRRTAISRPGSTNPTRNASVSCCRRPT